MRKLDDIPKKEIFSVPEDYFDKLPTAIQGRITSKRNSWQYKVYFTRTLKYALPVIIFLAVGLFWLTNRSTLSKSESILATIQSDDLIVYLNESELTSDDFIDVRDLNIQDLNEIEEEVYQLNITDKDLVESLD